MTIEEKRSLVFDFCKCDCKIGRLEMSINYLHDNQQISLKEYQKLMSLYNSIHKERTWVLLVNLLYNIIKKI